VYFLTKEDTEMGRKGHAAEEIVTKLWQIDVLTAHGYAVVDAIRAIGITEVNCVTNCTAHWRDLLHAQ
jgi:hypothetical protein